MNIFILDKDPVTSARMACDTHASKMVLETAQLLCATHSHFGYPAPYKPTHRNHTCTVWVRASRANYLWLWRFGCAQSDEFEFRRGKRHKSSAVIKALHTPPPEITGDELTPFAQCMPDEYRGPDPVEAYRRFYKADKASFATWNWGRQAPEWWR